MSNERHYFGWFHWQNRIIFYQKISVTVVGPYCSGGTAHGPTRILSARAQTSVKQNFCRKRPQHATSDRLNFCQAYNIGFAFRVNIAIVRKRCWISDVKKDASAAWLLEATEAPGNNKIARTMLSHVSGGLDKCSACYV